MKIEHIEPKYTDLYTMQGVIEDDTLALIYGAISKYGVDPELVSDVKEYIKEQINK